MASPVSITADECARELLAVDEGVLCNLTDDVGPRTENKDRARFIKLVDLYYCHSYLRHVLNEDVGFSNTSWWLLCQYLANNYLYVTRSLNLWWTQSSIFNHDALSKSTGAHIKVVAKYPDGYPEKHKQVATRMSELARLAPKINQPQGLFDYFAPDCVGIEVPHFV